jgi:cell division septum initiation protein DivIVA
MGARDGQELVPLGTGFEIVKRGYHRGEVEEHLEHVEGDIKVLTADRDAAVRQASELARQLEEHRSRIDDMAGQIERLAQPPTTLEGLSERLQRMLRLAREEAATTRERAAQEADQVRRAAHAEAERMREHYQRLIADGEQRSAEMEAAHRETMEAAKVEVERLEKESEGRRAELDRESAQRRQAAEKDLEVALAKRRDEEAAKVADEEARMAAERREHDERIQCERADAEATATERLRSAAEDSDRRLAEADTEAQRRIQEATATAQGTVAEARRKVATLCELRDNIAAQLSSASALLADATPGLVPEAEERTAALPEPVAEQGKATRG